MRTSPLHPNTEVLLEAWRRMETDQSGRSGPPAADHPALLENLFVAHRVSETSVPFRITGGAVSKRLGREATGLDFLDIWRPQDRMILSGLIESVIDEGQPGLLQGFGQSMTGREIEVEIALAPLGRTAATRGRLLGLYQPVNGVTALNGQSVWRHQLHRLVMPEPRIRRMSHLRLVASND